MAIDNKLSLKEEYFNKEEIKKDLEIYNKDKKRRKEDVLLLLFEFIGP